MASVINLARAKRPRVTEVQRNFAKELIGLGLARLTITSLMLGKSIESLNHADINLGNGLINKLSKELKYNISDARRAQSPFMAAAVRQIASAQRVKVKFA